jgi:hypothetical protein
MLECRLFCTGMLCCTNLQMKCTFYVGDTFKSQPLFCNKRQEVSGAMRGLILSFTSTFRLETKWRRSEGQDLSNEPCNLNSFFFVNWPITILQRTWKRHAKPAV